MRALSFLDGETAVGGDSVPIKYMYKDGGKRQASNLAVAKKSAFASADCSLNGMRMVSRQT